MTVRKLRHMPAAVLRKKALKVPLATEKSIQRLIDDMMETMQEAGGVGLAGPQVGVSLRVIVLQMPEEEPIAIVNPEIVKQSGEGQVIEGCLSLPGQSGEIMRYDAITVKGLDRQGKKIRIRADGLKAQALQHELDHLNGVLYIDHLEEEIQTETLDTIDDINAGGQLGSGA
jgi:peptide deformylase